jgi:hypothetical protein
VVPVHEQTAVLVFIVLPLQCFAGQHAVRIMQLSLHSASRPCKATSFPLCDQAHPIFGTCTPVAQLPYGLQCEAVCCLKDVGAPLREGTVALTCKHDIHTESCKSCVNRCAPLSHSQVITSEHRYAIAVQHYCCCIHGCTSAMNLLFNLTAAHLAGGPQQV